MLFNRNDSDQIRQENNELFTTLNSEMKRRKCLLIVRCNRVEECTEHWLMIPSRLDSDREMQMLKLVDQDNLLCCETKLNEPVSVYASSTISDQRVNLCEELSNIKRLEQYNPLEFRNGQVENQVSFESIC